MIYYVLFFGILGLSEIDHYDIENKVGGVVVVIIGLLGAVYFMSHLVLSVIFGLIELYKQKKLKINNKKV